MLIGLIGAAVMAVGALVSAVVRRKNADAANVIDKVLGLLRVILGALEGSRVSPDVVASIKGVIARLEANPKDVGAIKEANALIAHYGKLVSNG